MKGYLLKCQQKKEKKQEQFEASLLKIYHHLCMCVTEWEWSHIYDIQQQILSWNNRVNTLLSTEVQSQHRWLLHNKTHSIPRLYIHHLWLWSRYYTLILWVLIAIFLWLTYFSIIKAFNVWCNIWKKCMKVIDRMWNGTLIEVNKPLKICDFKKYTYNLCPFAILLPVILSQH